MTYLQFLILFLLPCVCLSAAGLFLAARRAPDVRFPLSVEPLWLAAVVVMALLYTTPWDSWLIRTGAWTYQEGSVLATVFGVPVEEYLFMIGLTALTACWTLLVASSTPVTDRPMPSPASRRKSAVLWLVAAVVGAVAVASTTELLYLGSTFAWFGVPLAVQAWFGADLLRSMRSVRLRGLALLPLLWLADAVAIATGAWSISSMHTIGVAVGTLPLEEAVFFSLVSLLVVNSVVLLGHPEAAERMRAHSKKQMRRATD